MIKFYATLLFLLLAYCTTSFGATRTAVASGNWISPSTWDCNCVPDEDDNVLIPAGRRVTVTFPGIDLRGATAIVISVYGELVLSTSSISLNASDAVLIATGGKVSSAGLGGLVVSGFTAITDFPINGPASITNGALPITLNYFVAEKVSDGVIIKWEIGIEENLQHYVVERSVDGGVFENISTVPIFENSSLPKRYELTDSNPPVGRVYYRLRATDLDGSSETFEVASVLIDHLSIKVQVYPNPFEGIVRIEPNVAFERGDYLVISNNVGKPFLKQSLEGTRTMLDLSSVESGIYYVEFRTHFGNFRERLVKR